mgnify:CR=1 FL=1
MAFPQDSILVFPFHLLPHLLHSRGFFLPSLVNDGNREQNKPDGQPPEIDREILRKMILGAEDDTLRHVN